MSAEDKRYRAWVHTQDCCGHGLPDWTGDVHWCAGDEPVDQSHERDHTGMSLKSGERRSVMKCRSLHLRYEAEHVRARDWMRERIAEFSARFDREQAAVSAKERTQNG